MTIPANHRLLTLDVKILVGCSVTLLSAPLAFASSLMLNSTDLAGFVCLHFTFEILLLRVVF